MDVRGATQIAAFRGAGNSRLPHGKRGSVETAVRRMVSGSSKCETSAGNWPGEKTLGRPPVMQRAGWPQAKSR